MMVRHVLKTDGAWVELRDVEDLRARDRKAVMAVVMSALAVQMDEEGEVDVEVDGAAISKVMEGAPDVVAARLITSWHLPYAPDLVIPLVDPESLGELKLEDYDRLKELIEPAQALLMPGDAKDPSDYADQTSPSGPASD